MRSDASRVGHAKGKKKKKKKETEAIRPRVRELKQNRELKHREFSAIFVWVPEWASNTKERASAERSSPKNIHYEIEITILKFILNLSI